MPTNKTPGRTLQFYANFVKKKNGTKDFYLLFYRMFLMAHKETQIFYPTFSVLLFFFFFKELFCFILNSM